MTRGLLALIGALVLAFGLPATPREAIPAVAVEGQPDPATITVYVTRTGEEYHRDGCRYLSRSKIPMSLKEAAKRFGPCSVCRPPTVW
jgi:competence protein ComEC